MLENFTDEEIVGELLPTGYLVPKDPTDDRRIEAHGSGVKHISTRQGSGERHTERYRSLKELLLCESMTFDEIRANWRYHGVLLGSPDFCKNLVHDNGCWCVTCKDKLIARMK